jgi:cysteinyl-tRNA synthetase
VRRLLAGLAAMVVLAAACSDESDGRSDAADDHTVEGTSDTAGNGTAAPAVDDFVYQLQGYEDDGLDALTEAPQELAVIDLARDGYDDYFTADEIGALQESGKTVLAYFEIGSIEDFRPEHSELPDDVILNQWPEWPEEYFVRYWEPVWWDTVIQPRVDQALAAGFDGVYLDTPLAYEDIDLSLVEGEDRETLGRKMVELIERISAYGKERDPDFLVFPQNSPELRQHPGYVDAIDGLGVEGMFFTADEDSSDQPCEQEWCPEDLDNVRALRDAGKVILAVDYATEPGNVEEACGRYEEEGFAGYVTVRPLDTIAPPCP